MVSFTVAADSLLLNAVNPPGHKDLAEFALELFAVLLCQDLKNISAQHEAARQTEFTQLTIAVPRDDLIFAVDGVQRQRQRVDNRLGEALLHFGFGGSSIDFLRQRRIRFAGLQIQARDLRRKGSLLRSGINQAALNVCAIFQFPERNE